MFNVQGLNSMRAAPNFLPADAHEGDGPTRRFRWVAREEGHGSWLTPLVYASTPIDEANEPCATGSTGGTVGNNWVLIYGFNIPTANA